MSIEAMKQALEALEIGWSPTYVNGVDAREKGMKAITSLRQAIAEAEKQEPVSMYRNKCADGSRCLHGCHTNERCYTHPQPKREWVGLTDEERVAVQYEAYKEGFTPLEFMGLHEAKLKEKNT